jgi:demethylmenaquinone methyltransferase/2-methoxy-6-polyprenyl-1,4-benzoquinol methylase
MDEATAQRLIDEQQRYYRARAPEYDEWWQRSGAYDRGPHENAQWRADIEEVERAVEAFAPRGAVLELAAGTGLWTRHLVRHADSLTAVDAAPEALALNRARVGDDVDFVLADIFEWAPPRRYDACFFGFWISHVPAPRFAEFWQLVERALVPDGRVFFVDTQPPSMGWSTVELDGEVARRRLNDGREFEIVKRYYDPSVLQQELAELGWALDVRTTAAGLLIVGVGATGGA